MSIPLTSRLPRIGSKLPSAHSPKAPCHRAITPTVGSRSPSTAARTIAEQYLHDPVTTRVPVHGDSSAAFDWRRLHSAAPQNWMARNNSAPWSSLSEPSTFGSWPQAPPWKHRFGRRFAERYNRRAPIKFPNQHGAPGVFHSVYPEILQQRPFRQQRQALQPSPLRTAQSAEKDDDDPHGTRRAEIMAPTITRRKRGP